MVGMTYSEIMDNLQRYNYSSGELRIMAEEARDKGEERLFSLISQLEKEQERREYITRIVSTPTRKTGWSRYPGNGSSNIIGRSE